MSQGKIVQIIGAVVDVEFHRDEVPKIYDALKVGGTEITLECSSNSVSVVRTIALGVDTFETQRIASQHRHAFLPVGADNSRRTFVLGTQRRSRSPHG